MKPASHEHHSTSVLAVLVVAGLTASTERRHRRMQSYDLIAELWRQAGRIRISACHQRKDVDTGCVVQ